MWFPDFYLLELIINLLSNLNFSVIPIISLHANLKSISLYREISFATESFESAISL